MVSFPVYCPVHFFNERSAGQNSFCPRLTKNSNRYLLFATPAQAGFQVFASDPELLSGFRHAPE
jgi:hypothetical protein